VKKGRDTISLTSVRLSHVCVYAELLSGLQGTIPANRACVDTRSRLHYYCNYDKVHQETCGLLLGRERRGDCAINNVS